VIKRTIIFIVFLLFSNGIFCATWKDVALTAANNDDYVSAQKQLDSSEWSYKKAWTSFFPQVSASAGYNETTPAGTTEVSKSYSMGLNVSQSLFKGFQNYNSLRTSYASYQSALANMQKVSAQVYYDLRVAFVDMSIAQENIALSEKILSRLKENARMIMLRYDSGREDKGNLLSTVASQKDGEYSLASANRGYKLAQLKLSQLASREIRSTDGTIQITYESGPDFEKLTESSPSFLMAKYDLETADIAAQNSIGGFLPSATLSWSDSNSGDVWPPADNSKRWSLNLSYSLFPGGSNIVDKFINDLNLDKARRDFESTRKSLRYSIENAYLSLKNAMDNLEVKRAQLDAAVERSIIADAKYQNGLITFDDWNRIVNDGISAQRNFLNAKKSALEASAAWKNSYGGSEL
jgi:outer membrane protein TolC